ncbi:hypothetical protein [Azospirillum rugosum]|uniref:Uncharacterized protein n=1 Tax=Azospirillum rugosum TaxID=416170 RepID=A0ABS4SI47_9PROT|nr:hypothetical protein [Azospirillum rugosum]MBP2291607.1 hypothetical protein [Azospirillum rugosum]MDQ0524581.1 hypothetical protein [Azospirillum rugosum]
MSNHRQWVELDPNNGADARKPQDMPAGAVETAAGQPAQDSAATPEPDTEAER